MRRDTLRRGTALAVVAVLLALAIPPVAFAADTANCSEGPGAVNRHKGNSWSALYGVAAIIDGQTLNKCTNGVVGEVAGSQAWVNIEGYGSTNNIIQIGLLKCANPINPACDSNMHFVRAWGRSGCVSLPDHYPFPEAIGSWDGANHNYKVWRNSAAWNFYIDTTSWGGITPDQICWTPSRVTWFAETWDYGDALGGTSTDRLYFNSMAYASAIGGGFTYTGFGSQTCGISDGPNNTSPPFYCTQLNSNTMQVWTNR